MLRLWDVLVIPIGYTGNYGVAHYRWSFDLLKRNSCSDKNWPNHCVLRTAVSPAVPGLNSAPPSQTQAFGSIATINLLISPFGGLSTPQFWSYCRRASRDRIREGIRTSDLDLRGFPSFRLIARFVGDFRGES